MKYICDTNFIIRYLIADDQEMFLKTKEIFEKTKNGENILLIEQTILTEVVFVLSSFYKVPRDKISTILSELLAYKGIDTNKKLLLLTLEYYKNSNLHIVDCLLLASSKITALPVLTFD